nr:MAG TPA: hypothetical protein [Caudoviricetes sp.]
MHYLVRKYLIIRGKWLYLQRVLKTNNNYGIYSS